MARKYHTCPVSVQIRQIRKEVNISTELNNNQANLKNADAIINGQAKISEVARLFEEAFNINPGKEICRKYAEIKQRKL